MFVLLDEIKGYTAEDITCPQCENKGNALQGNLPGLHRAAETVGRSPSIQLPLHQTSSTNGFLPSCIDRPAATQPDADQRCSRGHCCNRKKI